MIFLEDSFGVGAMWFEAGTAAVARGKSCRRDLGGSRWGRACEPDTVY